MAAVGGYEAGPSIALNKPPQPYEQRPAPYEIPAPKPSYEVQKPIYQELPPKQPQNYEQKPPGYQAIPLKTGGPPGGEYASNNGEIGGK